MHLVLNHIRATHTSAGLFTYLLYEPPGPGAERRAMILFLHGSEQRGGLPSRVAAEGLPALIERGHYLPFVVLSPHCPKGRDWCDLTGALLELLDRVLPKLSINLERVYLTGISMGGFGAWKLAAAAPDRFAALAPVCGGGDTAWAPALRSLPTWAFHGAKDEVVPARRSQEMIEALSRLSAPVRLTIYDDLGHDCWTRTYERDDLYDWLLGQRREQARAASEPTPEHAGA